MSIKWSENGKSAKSENVTFGVGPLTLPRFVIVPSPLGNKPSEPSVSCICLEDHCGPTGLRTYFHGSATAAKAYAERILAGEAS